MTMGTDTKSPTEGLARGRARAARLSLASAYLCEKTLDQAGQLKQSDLGGGVSFCPLILPTMEGGVGLSPTHAPHWHLVLPPMLT